MLITVCYLIVNCYSISLENTIQKSGIIVENAKILHFSNLIQMYSLQIILLATFGILTLW